MPSVLWSSSDTAIATIGGTGQAVEQRGWSTTITATSGQSLVDGALMVNATGVHCCNTCHNLGTHFGRQNSSPQRAHLLMAASRI